MISSLKIGDQLHSLKLGRLPTAEVIRRSLNGSTQLSKYPPEVIMQQRLVEDAVSRGKAGGDPVRLTPRATEIDPHFWKTSGLSAVHRACGFKNHMTLETYNAVRDHETWQPVPHVGNEPYWKQKASQQDWCLSLASSCYLPKMKNTKQNCLDRPLQ